MSFALLCISLLNSYFLITKTDAYVTINKTLEAGSDQIDGGSLNTSFLYVTDLEIPLKNTDINTSIADGLSHLVEMGIMTALAEHLNITLDTLQVKQTGLVKVEIVDIRNNDANTVLSFISYWNNEALLSKTVARDLSRLSISYMSSVLHYPIKKLSTVYLESEASGKKWWIIGLILSSGLIFCVIGWIILFCSLNCPASKVYESRNVGENLKAYMDMQEAEKKKSDIATTAEHTGNAAVNLDPNLKQNSLEKINDEKSDENFSLANISLEEIDHLSLQSKQADSVLSCQRSFSDSEEVTGVTSSEVISSKTDAQIRKYKRPGAADVHKRDLPELQRKMSLQKILNLPEQTPPYFANYDEMMFNNEFVVNATSHPTPRKNVENGIIHIQ